MSEPLQIETRATRLPRAPQRLHGTVCIGPWQRTGGRKVTRAHVRLFRQPTFGAAFGSSLSSVAAALQKATGASVAIEGFLADAAVMPAQVLAQSGIWATFELAASASTAIVEFDAQDSVALLNALELARMRVSTSGKLSRAEECSLTSLCLQALRAVAEIPVWRAGLTPRLLAVHAERAAALRGIDAQSRHLSIDLRVRLGGKVTYPRLLVTGRAVEVAMLKVRPRHGSFPVPSAISRAEVGATIVAGRGFLSIAQLQQLSPGDAVEIAGLGWHAGKLVGAARLRTQAFEAHGALFPRGLELSRFNTTLSNKEPPMSDDLSRSLLPIEVEVELTRFSIPLAELATLRPGAVLPLRQHDSDPVTLRVGGRAIARAELVDIDGEVGARILQLVDRGEAP